MRMLDFGFLLFFFFFCLIQFKAEMRNSNITELNFSVPRIAIMDAGQKKKMSRRMDECFF